MPERDRFVRGMVSWLGFKQIPFHYDREARFAGETKYPISKMIRFATDAFLGYSMVLLRIAAILAMTLLTALLVVGLHAIYAWLFLDAVPGWTSITMLIIVVSAFQLLVLSILGEYIGRIYLEVKRRPLFIIDTIKRTSLRASMREYSGSFFDYIEHGSSASARRFAEFFCPIRKPSSVLDVGCGRGAWLNEWRAAGVVSVHGVDGPYIQRDRLLVDPEEFTPRGLSGPSTSVAASTW